ncbi:MAG: leucine-rich repeat protein [Candidatus Faecousia sp.]|jgi:hypothetical protein|uniref:leucine-rich repeat domain-containing protein n=1 Tax=Faecousia sp. TaxID=2952921 RepID=UPI002A8867BE|nr:leucine-rich repeat protein [Candidatus Faecousia sp.]
MAEQDFEIENGVVVDYQGTDTDIVIPDGVCEIGDGVFWGSDIESVRLPSSVKAICSEAFMNCHELRTVELPDSITRIEEEAFCNSGIRSIRLPARLKRIAEDCFSGSKLEEITLPDGVQKICDHAFAYCSDLTRVVLPPALKHIDSSAFANCTKLRDINLPQATQVDGGVFDFCTSLMGGDGFVVVNGMLFQSPAFSRFCEVTIPDRVRVIKYRSVNINPRDSDGMWFTSRQERWDAIEKKVGSVIRIPRSVEIIESGAFCGDITTIISESTAYFGCCALSDCERLTKLVVPKGTEISESVFGFGDKAPKLRERLKIIYIDDAEMN